MPRLFTTIDTSTPINVLASAKYRRSFAYTFTKDRMPVVITQVIDTLCRSKIEIAEKYREGSSEELKEIIGMLSKLKTDVQTNKALVPLSDSAKDAVRWNQFMAEQKEKRGDRDLTWFDCPFMFADCYFYRRIAEFFEASKTLSTYDPYLKQKDDALKGSMESIKSLSKYCNKITKNIPQMSDEELKEETMNLFQVCMWGNECDLAMAIEGVGHKSTNAIKQVISKKEQVICNDLECICLYLRDTKAGQEPDKKIEIDIIMDNAGYELFSDFCLADWLLSSSQVDRVTFHVKNMPWFVSDTNSHDILWVLSAFEVSDSEDILELLARWKSNFSSGKWKVKDDETYWTLPFSYHEMPSEDAELYNQLSSSSLLIFKGDLNYRKLLGDINWKFSTPFGSALKNFTPAPLVALRAVKTEILVGVDSEVVMENNTKDPLWMIKGTHGVIQFHIP
ncbi:damage-control phosphatase ARMT1-like isoform X2 [Ischnura elegans]|uniref:damage-control phosphatase ARMT1-like isoform X2 n=1 Tax=Ischnura elegans TaxID=197161 RepID=UPI001ED867A5|nr:damage-control phosphatase ARMT1-like isoform X2 [Ischnura elegans]